MNRYSFFINGILSGSVINTSTLVNPGGYIHLFGAPWNGDNTAFQGYIDELRMGCVDTHQILFHQMVNSPTH